MIFKPWDCAQPDEWLPQSLRLCWGGGDGGGGGFSGDGGGWGGDGGGWGGDGGFGGATTGGGDWGSSGSYDASGYNAGGDIGAWAGSAYDASTAGTGAGGGGDWGSFSTASFPDSTPGAIFTDVAGPNPGVTTGGGDWGSAGTTSFAGTGGGPGGSLFGTDSYGGGGGGFWGGDESISGPGGGPFGDYGGGGGGYTGGGGGKGGGAGSFGGGGRASVTDSTPGYIGTASGGKDVTQNSPSAAPTKGEAQIESAGPDVNTGRADADPDADPDASPSDFGKPAEPNAAPAAPEAKAEAAQQDSFASRFDAVSPAQQDSFASRFDAATPDAAPSAFGPESLDAQSAGEQGKAGQQQDSFDSRFGFDTAAPQDSFDSRFGFDTSAPAPAIEAMIPGGRETDFDYGPGQQTAAPNFDQVFADLGIQPGWNPAEQMAGRTGLAEPTDWGGNPLAASTDVSVGRDFNQAFDAFGEMPTGMDRAGDQRSEAEPSLTFNEMWGDTPYSTLPNDQLSRSARETLESDFSNYPNPGYVQGPQQQTWGDRFNATMNAIIDPVATVTMYPFTKGLDALMALPNTTNITDPATAWSNFAQNAMLGGSNIQSLNADAFNAFEAGQQGRAGANPDTTDYASVFEGAAPTVAQPAIEAFIPGGRETNFEYNVAAPPQAPIDVDVVRSDDPSVPADPRAQPTTSETPPVEPQAPSEAAPPAPPEAAPPAPSTPPAPPAPPQEARPAPPPSLIEQQTPSTQAPPVAPPGLVTMLPPPALTPQTQPPAPSEPDNQPDAPEPGDRSQPPQDPDAARPPGNIPGQLLGSRGQYDNPHADTPQTSRTYRDPPGTAYTQGRPGITFRTARQAGIQPLFRTEDINTGDTDAQLVENINRALRAMEQRMGIPANSLVATSGWRAARREEALEHGMDPRSSQASVRSRSNPVRGRSFPAAEPGHSNHGPGRALDFADSRARAWLRTNAREFGLETLGGTFDMPHIQLQRGQGGQRPSEQEQAEQRAIDAQNRQLAVDLGLLGPGRGNQQAGVPTPRARPSDAPQIEVARPPADIPAPTNLPPQAPQETRPPADIPAPAPKGPNEFDIPVTAPVRNATVIANNILKQATAHLNKDSGEAAFQAASVVAAKALAAAGIPAAMARSLMTKGAYEGAEKVGFGPSSMGWNLMYKGRIDGGIEAALQGYQPAKPGELRGPPSPFAPGKQGALPFGQQFAGRQGLLPVAADPDNSWDAHVSDLAISKIPIDISNFPFSKNIDDRRGEPPFSLRPGTIAVETDEETAQREAREAMTSNMGRALGEQSIARRGLAKGGHVAKDEPVVVGEEGPETFVPDTAGTVVPHMPQPGKTGKSDNIDRWPKIPAPQYPGRYGGVEREMLRQTREAQNPVPSLMDLIDSGRLPLNAANWHRLINNPSLIALGQSRIEDRKGIDPGAEQYGAFIPAPAPAAEPPDPANPLAQALGYGSIKRRPMQIGRQSY